MSGNYVDAVLRIATSAEPGSGLLVTVLHDAWCAHLAGTGPCDCDPDLVVRTLAEAEA
jgi:hypothetical protein